jgi:glycosyltransferase involved in cell wall biosynthesis
MLTKFSDRTLVYIGTALTDNKGAAYEHLPSHAKYFNKAIFIAQSERTDLSEVMVKNYCMLKVSGYLGKKLGIVRYLFRLPYIYLILYNYIKKQNKPIIYLTLPSPFAISLIPLLRLMNMDIIPIIKGDWSDNIIDKHPWSKNTGIPSLLEKALSRHVSKYPFVVTAGSVLSTKFGGYKTTHVWRGTTHNKIHRRLNFQIKNIAFLGRLDEQKRCVDLINALRLLKNIGYNNLRVKVAGDGVEMRKLINLANELEVDDQVTFLGWVSGRKNIDKILDWADITVLLSTSEGTPKVIPESMSRGSIVISTPVGDVPLIIERGRNGFLIDIANPEQLKDTIIYLINNADVAKKIINQGYKYAMNNTLDKQVDSLWKKAGNFF